MFCFFSDFDFVTFHLPVSSNLSNGDEADMCPIPEEFADPKVDPLSIEPNHCAGQLTAMDAVSTLGILGGNSRGSERGVSPSY